MLPIDYYRLMLVNSSFYTGTNVNQTWRQLFLNYMSIEKSSTNIRGQRRLAVERKIFRILRGVQNYRYGLFLHLRNLRMHRITTDLETIIHDEKSHLKTYCTLLMNAYAKAETIPLKYHAKKKFIKHITNRISGRTTLLLRLTVLAQKEIRLDEVCKSRYEQQFIDMIQFMKHRGLKVASHPDILQQLFAVAYANNTMFETLIKMLKTETWGDYSVENAITSGILGDHGSISVQAMKHMIDTFGLEDMQSVVDGRLYIFLMRHDREWVTAVQELGLKFDRNTLQHGIEIMKMLHKYLF